jgi:hypothetical protein
VGEGGVGVGGVIGACSSQHSPACSVSLHGARRRYSLCGLGQKAYQVLAAHGRVRRTAGRRSAGCHSLCSGRERGERVCQRDGVGVGVLGRGCVGARRAEQTVQWLLGCDQIWVRKLASTFFLQWGTETAWSSGVGKEDTKAGEAAADVTDLFQRVCGRCRRRGGSVACQQANFPVSTV